MNCPLCGEKLVDAGDAEYSVDCRNEKCAFGQNRQRIYGSEELFALFAKAKQGLKKISERYDEEYYKGDDEHDECDWLNCADDMEEIADTVLSTITEPDEIKKIITETEETENAKDNDM